MKENNSIEFAKCDKEGYYGDFMFSFDGKQIYNLSKDYPDKLTREQKAVFDAKYPFWALIYKHRS